MSRSAWVLVAFLVGGIISTAAYAAPAEVPQSPVAWRTQDPAFHELLLRRRQVGPEHVPEGLRRPSAATWISQPTANMYEYDVTHYRIDIRLNFTNQTIQSVATLTARSLQDNLTYVDLTFNQYSTIDSLRVGGQAAAYNQGGELLTVDLPVPVDSGELFNIKVGYHGYAPYSAIGGGLSYQAQYTSQICQTECEPFGARNWFPCKDFPFDKADSADLYVRHPALMTTSGNGLVVSITDNGDGTKTTHWSTHYPITTYVIHFVTAYQSLYQQKWGYAPGDTMPVVVYAYGGFPEYVNNYLTYTIPGLQILSQLFGLYPFSDEKYGNSFYDLWGMENQTMTVLIYYIATEDIIIHEMAHHWWGDLITCQDFHHIWLNEGFGTYTEALYYEHLYGSDYYHDYIQNQDCLDLGSVYVENLDTDPIFDGGTSYNKGSRVLHMLRHLVGDSAFFQILREYVADPNLRYGTATTQDFQAHCESVYGSALGWFFTQWIYQPGNPHYEYGWKDILDTATGQHHLGITIAQTQATFPVFQMPIDVQVFMGANDTTFVIFDSNRKQSFILDLPAEADSVKIDPNDWILCTKGEVPFSMAIATDPVDTAQLGVAYYLALEAVGGTPPYTWQKLSGQYPYGTTLYQGDSAYLAGVPNYAAAFHFQMRVYDSSIPPVADTLWFHITVVDQQQYLCGDANADSKVNVADAIYIINYVFVPGSPAPHPSAAGDPNCDTRVNVTDAVYLINRVFIPGSPAPCDPDGNGVPDC